MATMWLTTFAVAFFALAQVGGYPSYQAPTSLDDLPIDCPFHREPVGVDHIGDTAYGTLTQTGNYRFDNIPGNVIQSGQDYAGYAQNNQFVSQAPNFFQNYQQPQSYPEQYYSYNPQQFPDFNNQYQIEEGYVQALPYYENSYNPEDSYMSTLPYYGDQNLEQNIDCEDPNQSQDGFVSTLPYYGEQIPEQNVQYDYENQYQNIEQPAASEDVYSILPYPNNNVQEECEQENDYFQVVQVIETCKTNLNAIYEGACEEITEAEETAGTRIEEARARSASQSFDDFGLNADSSEQGFTRSLFSLFKPQKMISMPMKAVSAGMDTFVLSPLQAISKQPAKKITEPVRPKEVQKPITPVQIPASVPETVQPEVKAMQNAIIEDRPQASDDYSRAMCLRSVSNDLNRQFFQNNQEANQCINNAQARFQQTAYLTRQNVNQQRGNFENKSNYEAELLTMCANSQYKKCQEEEDALQQTNTDFATNVNNELARISDAEELLKQELAICGVNAETRHAQLRDEASAGKSEC